MNYGYFPGCSLHSTAKEFNISTKAVCSSLKINFTEVEDWICCGATPAHTTNHDLGLALPYSNLQLAVQQGFDTLVAPCAACYNRLKVSDFEIRKSDEKKNRIHEITEDKTEVDISILHLIEFFKNDFGIEEIKSAVKNPLVGLRVASYYGCLLVRPNEIVNFDDEENPTSMDEIVFAIGADALDWSHKTECCGAAHAIPKTEIVLQLCKKILQAAENSSADCIAVACPLCHANLDMRQNQINKTFGTKFNTPILYITQLMGLALGYGANDLSLQSHFVDPIKLLTRKNLIPQLEKMNREN